MIWYFIGQERATEILGGWRVWLTANYATIMTVVLVLFGVILSVQGLAELAR